jgi:DNA-directed RNA polymerase subunit RPC12/RpoP
MKTEYQILQKLTRLENLDVSPEVDYLTYISALQWVLSDSVSYKDKYPEIVFRCRKCGHNLFIAKESLEKALTEIVQSTYYECPTCGEQWCDNWILEREGNYDKEFGKKK